MELEALKQRALGCLACPLSAHRLNVVFGEGDPTSPLVLIGEGPGEMEDRTGRPFVGRAGQLLDKALRDAGLSREQVYITNTVKCRAADWSTGKPVNRPPTEAEALACRQWLIPQLGAIRPSVILCIGGPSAQNVIRRGFKITQERGRYFACDFARAALATLHPSYILRQMNVDKSGDGGYGLLVGDIHKAWTTAMRLRQETGPSSESRPDAAGEKDSSQLSLF